MLSQLESVTLAPEVIEAAHCRSELSREEQTAFDMHPSLARNLLSNIPRLDGIAWIVGQQRFGAASPDAQVPHSIRIGADILRLAIAFDDLKIKGNNESEALAKLQYDPRFDPQMVRALTSLRPEASNMELKAVRIADLATGMILQEEIGTNVGMLLVGRGQEVSYPLIVRLNNFHQRRAIPDKVRVLSPSS